MFPIVPHSTDWDIGRIHEGNGEGVVLGVKPALGETSRAPNGYFFKLPLGRGRSRQARTVVVGCSLWGYKPRVPRAVS